ncbi:AbiH family protein [Anaerovorax sp. IOR16]|uniref:AbiH family protein n=1 Tax=Anaerovorax sp. IOR16 TaxID=2773458 RepID=UPI0019D0F7E3|nr:AbiH family protein [Anaerovorax sp. IOR16]
MNLFVIGNGFDKAHSLKTDYINFRDFLYETDPDFLSSFEEAYGSCSESNRELKLIIR